MIVNYINWKLYRIHTFDFLIELLIIIDLTDFTIYTAIFCIHYNKI